MDLCVRNGARVVALVVGSHYLSLPTTLVLELKDYYFVLIVYKNIILVSTLDRLGCSFNIDKDSLSFSLNNIHYGIATLLNSLYAHD